MLISCCGYEPAATLYLPSSITIQLIPIRMMAERLCSAVLVIGQATRVAWHCGSWLLRVLLKSSNASASCCTFLHPQVIIKMLERESLLTQAKLHALEFDRINSMQQLQRLKSQIRQVGPQAGTSSCRNRCMLLLPRRALGIVTSGC